MSPVLVNGDGLAPLYFCRETDDIPISEANAAMARGVANRIGIVGAAAPRLALVCGGGVAGCSPRDWR